jgi:hypothetical protein
MVSIPHDTTCKRNVDPKPAWVRDSKGRLFIRCECGLLMGLTHHSIAADGTVSPSLYHAEPQCGWHVWGRLEDWRP